MTQTIQDHTSSTPQRDDEIARTLLIELLAHQFCHPVQWIDTQDSIIGHGSTQRIVEMGPSNTLANMAKRTIANKYSSQDTATNTFRELLPFQQHLDGISYEQYQEIDSEAINPPDMTAAPVEVVSPLGSEKPAQSTDSTAPPHISTEIEDSPPTFDDVVSAIVSSGLKRSLKSSNFVQSIKNLCAGRSTLQNEILGDLDMEFGSLPDGAEDLSLEALRGALQTRYCGNLGTKSSSLIERMASQKLPGSFQVPALRKHLKQAYGLRNGRQNTILLHAVNEQVEGRLKEDEAKRFFDDIVKKYMEQHSLTLPDSSATSTTCSGPAIISAETLEYIESRQKTSWEEQAALYTNLLGLDVHASQDATSRLQQRVLELEQQLDGWIAEHGELYASGVQPLFTPLKIRVFDSWWNWAMQDLLQLMVLTTENFDSNRDITTQLVQRIANRSHERLLKVASYLAESTKDARIGAVLRGVFSSCKAQADSPALIYRSKLSWAPETVVGSAGKISYQQIPRPSGQNSLDMHDLSIRLGRKRSDGWDYSEDLSCVLRQVLAESRTSGLSLAERNVLITGAGPGSIGCQLVSQLLSAGATVVVTSSSYSPTMTRYYQDIYATYGGKGSKLILLPFNQASVRDIEALVKYVYAEDGLDMDLDILIPFAAISENGRSVANIDSKSELAHRLMLTNTFRLLGQVKQQKQERNILTRPVQVIIPLSPNHGCLGNDGLYAESKLGLESLLEKFRSEDWDEYLLICGAIIGWTRGTNLMSDTDVVAQGMEKLGLRTFSQEEMAFNILALLSPAITRLCVEEPLVADLSGGMADFPDIKAAITEIRVSIQQLSEMLRAVAKELDACGTSTDDAQYDEQINPKFSFPRLPQWEYEIQPLARQLEGMVDLDRVVVVAGFAEVGPWGNARVRWDMEVNGCLSPESSVELAWIMGLIKAHSGMIDGQPYSGWLDQETGKRIADTAVCEKYGSYILEHAGVRFMEPKRGSPSWNARESLHVLEITKDHEPFEVGREAAQQLKQAHGEKVKLTPMAHDDRVRVVLTKGAEIMIPKLIATQHTVGGQIPAGWDPRTYGIPEDIISQVDPVTLYTLVAAAEALHSAGLRDAFELYNHLHISDVANCVGSGLGGLDSFREIFKGRYRDDSISNDVLSEVFISSGSAWINMLLLSAAGANRTPVGACATALESLDTACDLIQTGKARLCLVGAFDDMAKDLSEEFANLKATINADEDLAAGRDPSEMSRPATSTRGGFVESEGAGIQVVTSASVALEMGLPIYSIVAMTHTAMDKAGRSIPAPGRGLVGAAKQTSRAFDSPWMNMAYRRRALQNRLRQIQEMYELQLGYLDEELATMRSSPEVMEEQRALRLEDIKRDSERDRREALYQYGNRFWTHDKGIAPIRGALAVWGLTVNDLDFTSFHGTSTRANEKNEAMLVNAQLRHLGRKEGNILPVVLQKSLTGHPKGPAGAWMLNGCIQAMHEGRIPGNRNGDNIDSELEECECLVFPNKTVSKKNIKAFSLQLFGFGQKGGMAIGVHPRYLYATMQRTQFEQYSEKLRQRERKAMRQFHEGIFTNCTFQAKQAPPYPATEELKVLLDPNYRTEPI